MSGQRAGGRIFGLDVMRAAGGILVVLAHTGWLVSTHWPRFPMVPHVDWVDLFFVLSGFLIGGMLLDATESKGTPGFRLIDFLQRRWLRSIPNYWLFVLVNVLLLMAGLAPGLLNDRAWAYMVFMQNLHEPLDLFFWESWSLAVEEWFYLLFPIIVFGSMALFSWRGKQSFLLGCIIFITFPIAARFVVAHHVVDPLTWGLWVKKLVITRLDAPGLGMLAAYISRGWPKRWHALRWPAFVLGAAILFTVGTTTYEEAPVFVTYGLESVAPFSVALLLPLLSAWRSGGMLSNPIRRLSLITYALYLIHMPMVYLFGKYVEHPVAWVCAFRYALLLAAMLSLSALVFLFWERPFMKLRDPIGRWLRKRIA